MKRFLASLAVMIGVTTLVIGLTRAFFSDTETSTDNVFQAGKVDLKIDNTSYYNGQANPGTTWQSDDLPGHLFFDFDDIKPSDWGEDTISITVEDNNAWACMEITLTEDDDETCTEPELAAGNDPSCNDPDADAFDGELGNHLSFIFWADDGDNVLEQNEVEKIFKKGQPHSLFDGVVFPLADSLTNIWGPIAPLTGGQTYYVGKAWCFGALNITPVANGQGVDPTVASGFTCNGAPLNNASQSDILKADVEFTAYQSRNNPNFTCNNNVTPSVTPTIKLTQTPTPTPLACQQADVMLVLDRSGSISGTELGQLKTASKDFVDALGPTTLGIHVGFSSFATTGSLNQHLSDDGTTVKNAIDALVAGGFTNLKEGLDLSLGEHANPGDGHDRADGTSPDKVIVVTDGHPNRPLPSSTADDVAKTSADAYRLAGAEVFVVGIGSDVNQSYLETIADDAGHYYSVSDYSGLQATLQALDLCDE